MFLFNFFQDSRVKASQWRIVFDAMNADERAITGRVPAPTFDEKVHAGVRSEVSCLDHTAYGATAHIGLAQVPIRCNHKSKEECMDC